MKVTPALKKELANWLDTYWTTYLKGDIETWATLIRDDYRNIGGTREEIWNSKQEIINYTNSILSQMIGTVDIRNRKVELIPYGEYMMVHEFTDLYVKIEGKWTFYGPFRMSSLLEKADTGWIALHQHGSYPDMKAMEGEAFSINALKAENAKLQDAVKSRTIDLEEKNRELEIEAATERVRVQAMAMQQPDDLEKVNKEILNQLNRLQVPGLTGVTFYLIDENGWVKAWDFSSPGSMGDPNSYTLQYDFKKYEMMGEPFRVLLQTDQDFFVADYSLEKLERAVYELEEINPAAANVVKEALANGKLTHQWSACARISNGLLGIDLVSPPNEDTESIVLKIAGAFNQAYQRFLDLQKAEAQAKEAEIELALERVRSRSMAMHKSDELKEVIKIVYQQLIHLKINIDHAGFVVDYTPGGDWHFWIADEQDILSKISHPYFESVWANQFNEAKEKEEDFFATHLDFEEKNKFYNELLSYVPGLPEVARDFYLSCPGLAASTVMMDNVALYIENFSGTPYTDNENKILMRFGNVFQQTYTRFLDLQRAEAQTREATIESSLERIRAKAMSMHHSDELDEVLVVLWEQFDVLGIRPMSAHMTVVDIPNNKFTFRETGKFGNRSFGEQIVDIDAMDVWKEAAEQWRRSEPETVNRLHFPKESLPMVWQVFQQSFASMPADSRITPDDYPDGIYHIAGKHPFGYIGINQIRQATDEEEHIVTRFASEFGRAYQRFLDLQKAEAQAREAQIENALEKVRSRTMAMQKSEELPEAANVLFMQVQSLGIPAWSCGYNILSGDKKTAACCMSSEGTLQTPFKLRLWGEASFDEMGDFLRSEKTMLVQELDGKSLEDHYAYMKSFPDLKPTFEQIDELGLSLPTYQINHLCKFTQGFLLFITYEPVPEAQEIFKRFAKVFEQTYTRFLDLQKAEGQARESQIEAALERVRSRTLAMQKSDELAETAAVLFQQLITLGIEPNRLYISIIKNENGDSEFWITDEDGSKVSTAFATNMNENATFLKMFTGWKQQQKSLVINMQGEELQNYFRHLTNLGVPFKNGLSQKRRVQDIAYFNNGFIGMASPDEQPAGTLQLLERFAAVFNLTFTRFNDLKMAEAHAEQAEKDLIAIKEAKQKAEEALTVLQSTQKQLIQSEKMASLGELTAGIAHEIQNPLNFVNNFSEVSSEMIDEMNEELKKGDLEEVKAISSDIKQNLEKINHHGRRADAIVKGMLQHSRTSSGQMELTDINALADEYLRLAYHGLRAKDKNFNAAIKTDFDKNLGSVHIIPQEIGRVVLNLITNAFYAVDQKKKLNIGGYEPVVSVRTRRNGLVAEISVADNGNGIPAGILDKIFQPFFTTKPTGQGTGLGLSLAYDIVKAHGGELKVETKENEGSSFIIQLPAIYA